MVKNDVEVAVHPVELRVELPVRIVRQGRREPPDHLLPPADVVSRRRACLPGEMSHAVRDLGELDRKVERGDGHPDDVAAVVDRRVPEDEKRP